MDQFEEDTRLDGGGGQYRASLSESWRGWSPLGGYLAAIAIRAAAGESEHANPASISCQFVKIGQFGEVQVSVERLHRGRVTELLSVAIAQDGQLLMLCQCWMVAELTAFDHSYLPLPPIPNVVDVPPMEERYEDWESAAEAWPYMKRVEQRIVGYGKEGQYEVALPPRQIQWIRIRPQIVLYDPSINAGRYALLLDLISWEAAKLPHPGEVGYFAPTLSLNIDFHNASDDDWLVAEAAVPIAAHGRFAISNRLWDASGTPLATATGTFILRRRPTTLP